jgi:hypothetical protein
MRPRTLVMPLAIGLAGYTLLSRRRRRVSRDDADAAQADRFARQDSFAGDPGDPVQGFDEASELRVMPLDIDAQSQVDAEAAQDLAGLESEFDEEPETAIDAENSEAEIVELTDRKSPGGDGAVRSDGAQGRRRDAGDLYGAHTPAASDRDHPDDDRAFDDGQNWLEALETSAIENGPEPERELDDIVDDEDVLRPPHASDTRDTPVADHGAGGRRGL